MKTNTQGLTPDDYDEISPGKWERKDRSQLLPSQTIGAIQLRNIKMAIAKPDHLCVAEYLLGQHRLATMRDTGEIYIYRDGFYQSAGETFLQEGARSILGDDFSTHKVN